MAAEIRVEVRGILRRIDSIRNSTSTSIQSTLAVTDTVPTVRRVISIDAIQEEVIQLAGMVWHLKDRLNRWISASGATCTPSVEELAANNTFLQLCRDLIDSKKHGGIANNSGFSPRLGSVALEFQGILSMRYDGALKVAELESGNYQPPITVELVAGDGQRSLGPAIDVICQAFKLWSEILENLDLFGSGNPEDVQLRRMLSRLEKGMFPVYQSELIGF